jgi:putative sigma-54 modulation protein
MDPSDHLKKYGHDKLARLEKYLDSVLSADLTFSIDKFRHRAEVVLTSDGMKIKALEETDDMYSSMDLVVDKLEKQLKRHMEKQKVHKTPAVKRTSGSNGHAHEEEDDDFEPDVITADRTRDLTLSRMNLTEAAELLAHGSSPFVVFLDHEDGGLRLLHQFGKGGSLELIRLHGYETIDPPPSLFLVRGRFSFLILDSLIEN